MLYKIILAPGYEIVEKCSDWSCRCTVLSIYGIYSWNTSNWWSSFYNVLAVCRMCWTMVYRWCTLINMIIYSHLWVKWSILTVHLWMCEVYDYQWRTPRLLGSQESQAIRFLQESAAARVWGQRRRGRGFRRRWGRLADHLRLGLRLEVAACADPRVPRVPLAHRVRGPQVERGGRLTRVAHSREGVRRQQHTRRLHALNAHLQELL